MAIDKTRQQSGARTVINHVRPVGRGLVWTYLQHHAGVIDENLADRPHRLAVKDPPRPEYTHPSMVAPPTAPRHQLEDLTPSARAPKAAE